MLLGFYIMNLNSNPTNFISMLHTCAWKSSICTSSICKIKPSSCFTFIGNKCSEKHFQIWQKHCIVTCQSGVPCICVMAQSWRNFHWHTGFIISVQSILHREPPPLIWRRCNNKALPFIQLPPLPMYRIITCSDGSRADVAELIRIDSRMLSYAL